MGSSTNSHNAASYLSRFLHRGLEFRVFRVQGLGFRVEGLGFRVREGFLEEFRNKVSRGVVQGLQNP